MAVTLDITQLEARIQSGLLVTGDMAVNDELDGLLATATVMVETWCPEAPDAVMNEAVTRIAGYLVDRALQGHRLIAKLGSLRNSGRVAPPTPCITLGQVRYCLSGRLSE